MKALTLHQPWASLVALGVKTIETRSWSTDYRGPLAIHAGTKAPAVGVSKAVRGWGIGHHRLTYHDRVEEGYTLGHLGSGADGTPLPLGAVVATCTLVDVVPIVSSGSDKPAPWVADTRDVGGAVGHLYLADGHQGITIIDGQRPYGDFSPGRFAWLLADVKPINPPVPARGRQRLWEWAA